MPLTDPQPANQFWPPQGAYAQAAHQSPPQPRHDDGHARLLDQLGQAHQQLAYAVVIQREALCRVLGIEEATLLAAEKEIHQARNRPEPEITADGVQQIVAAAIEQNNQVVRQMLTEFAIGLARQGVEPPEDPMTADDFSPAEEDPGAIEMN